MIRSFKGRDSERLFVGQRSARLPASLHRVAQRKLVMLDAAEELSDLAVPPGNRLEKLSGDREGQFSMRINERWRICFHWADGDAYDVEVVDYH